jgi:hypothetical protein
MEATVVTSRVRVPAIVFVIVFGVSLPTARAQTLQAPIGGSPIPLGDARFACVAAVGGWSVDATGRNVRPPTAADAVGKVVALPIAASSDGCAASTASISLVATNRWPIFDLSSVVFSPDDARFEAKGRNLSGVTISWRGLSGSGADVCRDEVQDGTGASCAWAIGASATTALSFSWSPAGARAGSDVLSFDADGQRAPADAFSIVPARTIVRRLLPVDASVDLAAGQGVVPLVYPDAVASADCGALSCELIGGKLVVRSASSLVSSLDLKLRLRPHVFFVAKDTADSQPTVKVRLLYCPMSIVSGAAIRGNDRASVIVKLEGACANDLSSVSFQTDHAPLKMLRTFASGSAKYIWLQLGNIEDETVTITALRGETTRSALAVARSATRVTPRVRASIELPGFPNLQFIPNNRAALVHISRLSEHEHWVLLPIDDVYTVNTEHGVTMIRGDANAAGMASLRFGMRNDTLPDGLDQVNLAEVVDPLQRDIREANVPVSIGVAARAKQPLIEMLCGGGTVPVERVPVGVTAHLDFSLRDTCRVVFHRERLSPESGTQKLNFAIDIMRPDGSTRSEAHVAETFTFRAGSEPRYAFIRGALEPFDRVVVRVSHQPDEAHYIGASEIRTGAPAAQWSAVLGTGRARLYGTTTIPTGLYRLSTHDSSGVLSLNFGLISRLTWLDADGHEGFLGLEGGLLVMGLANSTSATGRSLTQVGGVLGLGVSVPIANRSSAVEASISVHAWAEADITREPGASSRGRYALIFGPSITIGNVGVNL